MSQFLSIGYLCVALFEVLLQFYVEFHHDLDMIAARSCLFLPDLNILGAGV